MTDDTEHTISDVMVDANGAGCVVLSSDETKTIPVGSLRPTPHAYFNGGAQLPHLLTTSTMLRLCADAWTQILQDKDDADTDDPLTLELQKAAATLKDLDSMLV